MNVAEIKSNLQNIQNQINEQVNKSGREAGCVQLLAVSKFHPLQSVLDAISASQTFFGENRVQEAFSKFNSIPEGIQKPELHIIGSLQKNKVSHAVQIATCIESVDRLDLIKEIEKACEKQNKTIRILFEYHTGEETKSGYQSVNELEESLEYCALGNAPHILPYGFMTMAPFTDDEKTIRSSFSKMRIISEQMKSKFNMFSFPVLSMGMSSDYKIAIDEGSTEVRIGTAIFGEREYSKK